MKIISTKHAIIELIQKMLELATSSSPDYIWKEYIMKKALLTLALISTGILAGGDIAPVEPVTDPIVTESGDALSYLSMSIMLFVTSITGSFFIRKEMQKN